MDVTDDVVPKEVRVSKSKRLLRAIKDKNVDDVEAIINDGGRLNRPIEFKRTAYNGYQNVTRKCHYTPICTTIAEGTEEILRFLIVKGANIHQQCHHVEKGNMIVFEPLFLAVDSKKLGMVEELLKSGVDANKKIVVLKKSREEEGGTLEYNYEGMCYLHYAAGHSSAQMMDLLMKYGADPNRRTYDCLERPIRLIQHDDFPKMYSLLAGGTDLTLESFTGSYDPNNLYDSNFPESLTLCEHFLSTMEPGDTLDDVTALLKLLHAAGYSYSNEMKIQIRCIVKVMQALEKNTRSLQDICRIRIRKQIGGVKFQEKLSQLLLPNPIKDYLSFRKECPCNQKRRRRAAETENAYLLPRDM